MVKFVRALPSLLTLLLLSGACNYQEAKVDEEEAFGGFTEADLKYAQVNERIFKPYCLSCHSSAGGNRGGINLESYDSIFTRLQKIRLTVIDQKTMPPSTDPQLPADAILMLDAWFAAGAPE